MSEICRFLGIVIAMYHREHGSAHFHARYGGQKVTVRIDDGYIEGKLPPRVKALLLEWWDLHDLHREELAENWQLSKEQKQLKPIPPLE